MSTPDYKLKLGLKARDKVTGFEGVIVSRTICLNGCEQYAVRPLSTDSSKYKRAEVFDWQVIEYILENGEPIVVQEPIEPKDPAPFELGVVLEERIGKFRGTAVLIHQDLVGYVQYALKPKANKDNEVPDGEFFPVEYLSLVPEPTVAVPKSDSGGPTSQQPAQGPR